MLWLGSFRCHCVATEVCTKLGKEAGLGAGNLLHALQFGGEEGDCNFPVGLPVLWLWKYQKHTDDYCIKQYMETPAITILLHWRNMATCPGEQHFILAKVNLWMCGTTVGCLNSQFSKRIFAALRVVVVGVATESKFSPVIPYMQAAL